MRVNSDNCGLLDIHELSACCGGGERMIRSRHPREESLHGQRSPGGALDGNQLGEQHQWQYDWIPPWSKAISTHLLHYWYPANVPLDSQLKTHQTSFVSHVQLDSAIVRSARVGVCNLTISVDFEI